jgi:hypothetical protein
MRMSGALAELLPGQATLPRPLRSQEPSLCSGTYQAGQLPLHACALADPHCRHGRTCQAAVKERPQQVSGPNKAPPELFAMRCTPPRRAAVALRQPCTLRMQSCR